MKTFGLLFYLLGVNVMKEMADSSPGKLDPTLDQRPPLFVSDEPEEDQAASTPSTSASETQDDDEIITLSPLSPSCKWCGDDRKLLQIPLSERQPENELAVMRFRRHCPAFGDYSNSRVIRSSVTPMNVPVNLSFSDDLYNHLSSHRRTRSLGYYNDVFVKYASGFGQGKLIIPLGKQINGYSEGNDILKNSLVVHLNSLEESTCAADGATRTVDKRETQQLEQLTRCPSLLGHNSLQKPTFRSGHHHVKRRSVSRMSDVTHLSCSSSLSTCSYDSASTQHGFISQAVLRCLWHKGTPYFVYTMADDLDEVYVASRWKVKSPDDRALDHIYLFYAKTGSKTAADVKVSPYHLAGKMKVSSCVTFVSSTSSINETEFVLFGSAQRDHRKQLPSKSGVTKNNGFSKNLFHVLRASNSRHQNSIPRHKGSSSPEFEDPMKETFMDELNQFLSDPASLGNLQTRNEMAAVVIRSHRSDSGREMASGGWGLKFLEKQRGASVDCSPEVSYHHPTGDRGKVEVKSTGAHAVSVLIPAGLHGGALSGSVGPSSLIERWKTGGKCDCGGWDLGCPLTVLCDRSTNEKFCPEEVLLESSKTVDLFVEGSKLAEPALRMVDVQEGLYVVYAQANISALQSFSIAVSMIHSQIPTLCPC